ncbi:MAG: hypothetical protein PUB99_02450 [Oscillospiraceae bacterium]|nr:hypothetical protein [Oscillospiraceae bacterium]
MNSYTFYIYAFPACKNADEIDSFRQRSGQGVSRGFWVHFVPREKYLFFQIPIILKEHFHIFPKKTLIFAPLFFLLRQKKSVILLAFPLEKRHIFSAFCSRFSATFSGGFPAKSRMFFHLILKNKFLHFCRIL